MKKKNKFCQSCAMPMSKDPGHGGTEADGSKSDLYCSYCYQGGEFTFKGTAVEFQEFCRKMMIENGQPRFLAWLFSRNLKRLERWKKPRA